jgi:hypothetical protein
MGGGARMHKTAYRCITEDRNRHRGTNKAASLA